MCDVAGGSFELRHFETGHSLTLEPNKQYVAGTGVMVLYKKDSDNLTSIVWYVDEASGALKTETNHLCVRQRQGSFTMFLFQHVKNTFR